MNPWQLAQQFRHRLATAVWPDTIGHWPVEGGASGVPTEGELLYGPDRVRVFAGEPSSDIVPAGYPFALIGIGGGTADEEDPGLLTQTFLVLNYANVLGDQMGEGAIIGGPSGGLEASASRGSMEIATLARSVLEDLSGADGTPIHVSGSATSALRNLDERLKHIAVDEFTIEAVCTSQLHYAAPQNLRHDGTDWTWDGAHCKARFDFIDFVLISNIAGAEPNPDPASGDVLLYTGTDESVTLTALSTRSYGVFARYRARDRKQAVEAHSEAGVGSWLVVP